MNSTLVGLGVALMVIGAFVTFFTLGIGIICTWPLLLIGFILFIVGLVVSPSGITIVQQPERKTPSEKSRYCPDCGRSIPFDAKICPYCKKDFEE